MFSIVILCFFNYTNYYLNTSNLNCNLQAKDDDASLNGKIVYSFLDTNEKTNSSELDLFKIDRTNGNMNVNFEHQNLDKKLGTYKITVKVNVYCLV